MMYIYITFIKIFNATPLHSTELFEIFFSLLTLSTAFLQKKPVGREKMHMRNTVNIKVNLLLRLWGIKSYMFTMIQMLGLFIVVT